MTTLPFLTEDDRVALQALRKAEPAAPEAAFVTFALSLGKNLQRDFRAADLRGYVLFGQDVGAVDLSGADLRGADLRDVRNLRWSDVLAEGALLSERGMRAAVDGAPAWLLRWATLRADRRSAIMREEIPAVLAGTGAVWSAEDQAKARAYLAADGPPVPDARKQERPMFAFGSRGGWGRVDE